MTVSASVDCCDEQHFKKPFIEAVSNCVASERNWRFWPITSKEADCKTQCSKEKMRASKSRIFLWLFEDDAWYLSANHQLSTQNQSYCEIIFDHIQPIQFAGLTIATSGGTLLQLKQSLKSQIKFGILKTNEQMNCSFRLFEIIQKFALKCSLFSAKFSRNLFALITVFYKRTELKKYTLGTEELHCVDVKGWQELTLMGRNKDKNFLCFLSCSCERRG